MTYEQVLELIGKLSQEVRELKTTLKTTQRKTDKQIKELATQIGGLGNKFGRFAEGMAFPSLKESRFGLLKFMRGCQA
jgi:hypothetical protein